MDSGGPSSNCLLAALRFAKKICLEVFKPSKNARLPSLFPLWKGHKMTYTYRTNYSDISPIIPMISYVFFHERPIGLSCFSGGTASWNFRILKLMWQADKAWYWWWGIHRTRRVSYLKRRKWPKSTSTESNIIHPEFSLGDVSPESNFSMHIPICISKQRCLFFCVIQKSLLVDLEFHQTEVFDGLLLGSDFGKRKYASIGKTKVKLRCIRRIESNTVKQDMNSMIRKATRPNTLPRGLRLRGPARALDLVSRSKFARPGEVYQLDHVLASSLSWFVKWRFLWTSWFVTLWLLLWLLLVFFCFLVVSQIHFVIYKFDCCLRRQRCSMSRIGCLNNLGYLWATLRCHGKE